jgi:hypothetical protein
MRSTYLVQRLEAPFQHNLFSTNPFAFGGGYKNGGLSENAMELLKDVWAFDYMGAAEFEFGDVPRALSHIVSNNPQAIEITITLANVADPKGRRVGKKEPKLKVKGERSVYIIAGADIITEVEQRVREIAAWEHNVSGLKNDYMSFPRALHPQDEFDTRILGWLEIDNGFLFFTDKTMWEKTCALFGISIPSEVSGG